MADLLSGTPPTPPTPPPVAGNGPGQPGGSISAPVPAQVSAPLFGGFRGGRPRKDGLKPGSPEALAADREKDRIRKERSRAVARAADPAPLPSAGQAPRPESAASAPAPDLAGWRAGDGGAFIPWESGMLDPLFKQLIPAAEQMTVSQLTTRAAKARLPGELVKDIEQDAR